MPPSPPLLSLADIATLARVQRPVTTTWRRRHPDFPEPVEEHGNRAWFDGREVADWLITTGLGNTPADDLKAELAAHGLLHHAEQIGGPRLVEVLGSLLCLHHMDEKPLSDMEEDALITRVERMDPDDEFFRRELIEDPELSVRLTPLAEELIEAAYTPGGAHEHLMAHRHRLGLTGPDTGSLSTELRRLVVQVADPLGHTGRDGTLTIADPHSLCGDLLRAVVAELDDPEDSRVLAAEPRANLARLTRRRLLLAGVPELDLDVQVGSELEERIADPDLLVTLLPYRPGEERSQLEVLEEVEALGDLLHPGKTAVVVGPADALVGKLDTYEAQARSRLLRSGLVESITTLPVGTDPYRPGYECALWTLTRDPVPEAQGRVLINDVGSLTLDEHVCAVLSEDILLWRAEGHHLGGHDPRYGQSVPIKELEERFGQALLPPGPPASRIVSQMVRDRPALITQAETRLAQAEQRAQEHTGTANPLRGGLVRRIGPPSTRVTIAALINQKRIVPVKGHRINSEHVDPDGQLDLLGKDEVLGRAARGDRRIDRLVLAAEYPHVTLTEPGDVVYASADSEFDMLIDHEGAAVVTFPARVLRVNPRTRRALTPRVLALLMEGAANTPQVSGQVRAPRGVGELVLPDLAPEEVRRLDDFLGATERRQALLAEQQAELDTIRRLTAAGFSDGTLTVFEH